MSISSCDLEIPDDRSVLEDMDFRTVYRIDYRLITGLITGLNHVLF